MCSAGEINLVIHKVRGQQFSDSSTASAAEAKCRKSPYDFAKHIVSVTHSP